MKIKIIAIISLIFACFIFGGCKTKGSEDSTYTPFVCNSYNYAKVKLPDGKIVEGQIDNWHESSVGVIVSVNGVVYYTGMANVVLMEVAE